MPYHTIQFPSPMSMHTISMQCIPYQCNAYHRIPYHAMVWYVMVCYDIVCYGMQCYELVMVMEMVCIALPFPCMVCIDNAYHTNEIHTIITP
jgi:hypothetical protein